MTPPQDLTYTCMHLHMSTCMLTCIHTYENEKVKPLHLVAEWGAGENTGQLPQCHCLLYKACGRTRYFHSYEALARGSRYKKLKVCLVYSTALETCWRLAASVQRAKTMVMAHASHPLGFIFLISFKKCLGKKDHVLGKMTLGFVQSYLWSWKRPLPHTYTIFFF